MVSDGRAMHGEGELVALNLKDGESIWRLPMAGMLTKPPVAIEDTLVFLNGRKSVSGLDLENGAIRSEDSRNAYSIF